MLNIYIFFLSLDYLDNGNNKMAIQQADKLLKKHRDLHCAKVSNSERIPDLWCAQMGLFDFLKRMSIISAYIILIYNEIPVRMGIS